MAENRRSDILFAFAVAIALLMAWQVRHVLLMIYVSALFAVVLGPGVELVQKLRIGNWRPNRGIAVLILLAGFVSLLAIFFIFAIPPIFRDLQQFAIDLPGKLQRVYERVQHWPVARGFDPSILKEHAVAAVGGAFGLFKGVFGGILRFLSFLVLLAYFIIDGERAFHWALSLVSPKHRQRLDDTFCRAERRVSKWLLGQFLLMLILGSSSAVVFGLLGIKYFVALAVFMGVANIVPIIGPVFSVIVAAVIAAFDSWTKAFGVVVFYLVYQQIENAFLTPRIMRSTVDLPGLAVIIALAIGGALAGVPGAIVAVPTAALVAVVVDEYIVK